MVKLAFSRQCLWLSSCLSREIENWDEGSLCVCTSKCDGPDGLLLNDGWDLFLHLLPGPEICTKDVFDSDRIKWHVW